MILPTKSTGDTQECDFHDLGTFVQAELSLDEIGRPKPPVARDEAVAELEFC
jgi:hypothetical protein